MDICTAMTGLWRSWCVPFACGAIACSIPGLGWTQAVEVAQHPGAPDEIRLADPKTGREVLLSGQGVIQFSLGDDSGKRICLRSTAEGGLAVDSGTDGDSRVLILPEKKGPTLRMQRRRVAAGKPIDDVAWEDLTVWSVHEAGSSMVLRDLEGRRVVIGMGADGRYGVSVGDGLLSSFFGVKGDMVGLSAVSQSDTATATMESGLFISQDGRGTISAGTRSVVAKTSATQMVSDEGVTFRLSTQGGPESGESQRSSVVHFPVDGPPRFGSGDSLWELFANDEGVISARRAK